MTPEDKAEIAELLTATEQRLRENQDRAVETVAGEISAFRREVNERFAGLDRQFTTIHSRLDRSTEMLTLLQGSTTILNTWADRNDRIRGDQQATMEAQILDLRRRLEALEKKAS
ncbi:MAG TPA: hypothetical protein VG456_19420 [Candidatus Sulfopaludibacter sp.]|jgi:hypothetical protein|nr:hypothetical protein [Candidatus Sulfopaludibacter sp.]